MHAEGLLQWLEKTVVDEVWSDWENRPSIGTISELQTEES